jgi:hypothetical protein
VDGFVVETQNVAAFGVCSGFCVQQFVFDPRSPRDVLDAFFGGVVEFLAVRRKSEAAVGCCGFSDFQAVGVSLVVDSENIYKPVFES